MHYVSKYLGFQNFKSHYVLTITWFSKSKEALKLLLNIPIILSSYQDSTITKTTIYKLGC